MMIRSPAGHVNESLRCQTDRLLHATRPSFEEVVVARDQGVRNRVLAYLAEHGAVEDVAGKATSVLKQAIGYEGTDAGFTQVVAAMAKTGLLDRHIKGKRTYRISSGPASPNGTHAPNTP